MHLHTIQQASHNRHTSSLGVWSSVLAHEVLQACKARSCILCFCLLYAMVPATSESSELSNSVIASWQAALPQQLALARRLCACPSTLLSSALPARAAGLASPRSAAWRQARTLNSHPAGTTACFSTHAGHAAEAHCSARLCPSCSKGACSCPCSSNTTLLPVAFPEAIRSFRFFGDRARASAACLHASCLSASAYSLAVLPVCHQACGEHCCAAWMADW